MDFIYPEKNKDIYSHDYGYSQGKQGVSDPNYYQDIPYFEEHPSYGTQSKSNKNFPKNSKYDIQSNNIIYPKKGQTEKSNLKRGNYHYTQGSSTSKQNYNISEQLPNQEYGYDYYSQVPNYNYGSNPQYNEFAQVNKIKNKTVVSKSKNNYQKDPIQKNYNTPNNLYKENPEPHNNDIDYYKLIENNDNKHDNQKKYQGTTEYEYYENNLNKDKSSNTYETYNEYDLQNKAFTSIENIKTNKPLQNKPNINIKNNKTEIQQPDSNKPINNNEINIPNTTSNQNTMKSPFNLPSKYLFHRTGLYNIGSSCYMNATLQCLLHVSPLIAYFFNIYLRDKDSLKKLNDTIPSKGEISEAFCGIIKSIAETAKKKDSIGYNNYYNAVSPEKFQETVGKYNPQFKDLEANDSKDLILYLLQVMHQELNYFNKNNYFTGIPNQYNRQETFMAFTGSYDATNYSIISYLFYGTSEHSTKCESCNNILYNFQKFEFLSFGVSNYHKKEFNIYNGFDDYIKKDRLTGDNQYYCNYCKKLCDAEIYAKILMPPLYLLINIDYGKHKKYMPRSIKYDDVIDITKYLSINFGSPSKYKITGICSHFGESGSYGHYIAFCRNKENSRWYQFNDSLVTECRREDIANGGNPYLLLYERIE